MHQWLVQSANVIVGSVSRKRKRRADADDGTSRSRPRQRLQDTHGISNLQKVNYRPSTCRKSIRDVCQLHNLDLAVFMSQLGRSPHLTSLPISVDEHTSIDIWHALRVRLHSAAHKSGTRMQRIRSKPANLDCAAKHDPVLFVNADGKTAQTAKLHGE